MVVRRSAQRCAASNLKLKSMGTRALQRVRHQRISNRAIMRLRQRRYMRQDNLGYPILVLHVFTHRSGVPSTAVQK